MMNNYQEPEVFEIGRAQDIVLGSSKDGVTLDSIGARTVQGDIEESDE
jgi:hypothetical protein